jgi:hypothetical protein
VPLALATSVGIGEAKREEQRQVTDSMAAHPIRGEERGPALIVATHVERKTSLLSRDGAISSFVGCAASSRTLGNDLFWSFLGLEGGLH